MQSPVDHMDRRKRISALVVTVACIIPLALVADAIRTTESAGSCFRAVLALTPGRSTLGEAKNILEYGSATQASKPCTSDRCYVQFGFETRLSWWHLIPRRRAFQGDIDVIQGLVQTIHFDYFQTGSFPVSVTVGPSVAPPNMPHLANGLTVVEAGSGSDEAVLRKRGFAELPEKDRAAILMPNVWCLLRIGGCPRPDQVLPGAVLLDRSRE